MYLAITMDISAPTTRFMSMAVAMFLSMFMEIFMEIFMEESALHQRKDLINFKLFVASSIIYTRWPQGVEKSLILDGLDEKKIATSFKKLLEKN